MKRARQDSSKPVSGGAKKAAVGAGRQGGGGAASGSAGATQGLTTNDALGYLREVKRRFQDNKLVYDQFLEVMKDFKAARLDTNGVVDKVKTLFKGHNELILGFNAFLPKGYEITLDEEEEAKPVEFDQAISYVNKIKKRFASDDRVYRAFLEILNLYRKAQKTITQVYDEVALLFRGHQDLLDEFSYFLPDTCDNAGPSNRAPGRVGKADGKGPAAKKKASVRERDDSGASKAKEAPKDKPVQPTPVFESSRQYLDLVKSRLRHKEAYQDFLKLLDMFGQDIVSMVELKSLVRSLLQRDLDLMPGFNQFVRHGLSDMEGLESSAGKMTAKEAQKARQQAANQLTKFMTRSIAELDLSACEQCTPSYRLLPRNYPFLKTTHRTKLPRSILNDKWVSVTTGSEDYSFKHMRKNQYEENLFRVEDDKFDLDILIECNRSAIRALEPVAERIVGMRPDEKNAFRLAAHELRPIHTRLIQRLYNDQGANLVDLLSKNPAVAVPVVLSRLRQKDAEWAQVRKEMKAGWQKTFDQNFHKSLDHCSFYFKQKDKRQLGSKAMISEARELAEKRRSARSTRSSSVVAGTVSPSVEMLERLSAEGDGDLTLDFSDLQVHEDVYKVVVAAIEEMLNYKTAQKAIELWNGFVEAFLGLPARKLPTFEEEGLQEKQRKTKQEEDEEEEDDDEGATTTNNEEEDDDDGQNEDEDEEYEDDDSNQSTRFARSRPLAAAVAGLPSDWEGKQGGGWESVKSGSSTFYCNDTIYVMFRLHHFLYDRMRIARQCAAAPKQTLRGRPNEAATVVTPEEAEAIHNKFMAMVTNLIDGTVEPGQYEDDCRTLMGTSSYVLFTLDKLIYKLIKQLQVVITEEVSMKLVNLWHYEARRSKIFPAAWDSLYYINALVVMHEDACFRFVRNAEDGCVRLTLLESNKVEPTPGLMDAGFSNYLSTYVESLHGEDSTRSVFLRRSLPSNLRSSAISSGNSLVEEALATLLLDARSSNGLECKLSCTSCKVSYVVDTEDSYVSSKRLGGQTKGTMVQSKAASDRFHQWIEKRQMQIVKEEEEEAVAALQQKPSRMQARGENQGEDDGMDASDGERMPEDARQERETNEDGAEDGRECADAAEREPQKEPAVGARESSDGDSPAGPELANR